MEYDWLIIDGYNLLYQDEALAGVRHDLQVARQQLVRRVERVAPDMARRVSVVFDGRERGRDAAFDAVNFEVLFSPSDRTADAVIERMVADSDNPGRILVVTSDNIEARIVSSAGALVLSSESFVTRCNAALRVPFRRTFGRQGSKPSTLGDFFPD